MEPRVITGIPVDSVRREVKGVVRSIGMSPATSSGRPPIAIAGYLLELKTTAANEGNGLAEGGRNGGK
jgi:hypothetical protein